MIGFMASLALLSYGYIHVYCFVCYIISPPSAVNISVEINILRHSVINLGP